MTLYTDGTLQGLPPAETNYWKQTSSLSMAVGANAVAIERVDYGIIPGELASVARNGVITDRSWMYSAVHQDGWEKESFKPNAGNWDAATEIAQSGDLPKGPTPLPSQSANWIRTEHHTWQNHIDTQVYYGRVFGKFYCND